MAKVPSATDLGLGQVQIRGAGSTPGQSLSTNADMFGAVQGRQAKQAAAGLDDLAKAQIKAQQEEDERNLMEVEQQIREWRTAQLQGEGGIYSRSGGNAIGAAKGVGEDYQKFSGTLLQGRRLSQEAAFRAQSYIKQQGTDIFGEVSRYERQEKQAYTNGLYEGRINGARQDAAFYSNDKQKITEAETKILSTLKKQAAQNGWSPEEADMERSKEISALHSSVIASMMQDGSPDSIMKAEEYFQENGDKITDPVERSKVDALFDAALPSAYAIKELDALKSSGGGGDIYTETLSSIESAGGMAMQNPNSSAKGWYQWTDDTARQYGLVGDGFDYRGDKEKETEALKKFTETNKKVLRGGIGRDPANWELYLAHQQGAVGASELLNNPDALAVQVVGFNEVVQNGGKADMTAGEFVKMWKKKYIAAEAKSGGYALGVDMNDVYKSASKIEEKYPGAGALLISKAEKFNTDMKQMRDQNKAQTKETALDILDQNGYDLTMIPAETVAAAKEYRVWGDVIDYAKQGGSDDPDDALELDLMTADQLIAADLSEYNISRATREKYMKKQSDLSDPSNKAFSDKVDQAISHYYRMVYKVDPLRSGAKNGDKNRFATIKNFIQIELDAERKDGKPISNKAIQEAVKNHFATRSFDPAGRFNKVEDINKYDVSDIPESDLEQIYDAISIAGLPLSDEMVLAMYRQKKLGEINAGQ